MTLKISQDTFFPKKKIQEMIKIRIHSFDTFAEFLPLFEISFLGEESRKEY